MRRASRHRARYALRRGRGVRAGAARSLPSGADGGESEEGPGEGRSEEGPGEGRSEEGAGSSDEGDEGSGEEGS